MAFVAANLWTKQFFHPSSVSSKMDSNIALSFFGWVRSSLMAFSFFSFSLPGIHSLMYPVLEYLSSRCSVNLIHCCSFDISG